MESEEFKLRQRANSKKWREKHREYKLEYGLRHYFGTLDKMELKGQYNSGLTHEEARQKRNERNRRYSKQNRDKRSHYQKELCKRNPIHKLASRLRCRVKSAVVAQGGVKSVKTTELIGCSIDELRKWLESQFKEGMSWENHGLGSGKWHIDHKIPCIAFDLTNPEEQKKCFHWSNMQPLWSEENLSKGKKIIHFESQRKTA